MAESLQSFLPESPQLQLRQEDFLLRRLLQQEAAKKRPLPIVKEALEKLITTGQAEAPFEFGGQKYRLVSTFEPASETAWQSTLKMSVYQDSPDHTNILPAYEYASPGQFSLERGEVVARTTTVENTPDGIFLSSRSTSHPQAPRGFALAFSGLRHVINREIIAQLDLEPESKLVVTDILIDQAHNIQGQASGWTSLMALSLGYTLDLDSFNELNVPVYLYRYMI